MGAGVQALLQEGPAGPVLAQVHSPTVSAEKALQPWYLCPPQGRQPDLSSYRWGSQDAMTSGPFPNSDSLSPSQLPLLPKTQSSPD